MTFVAVDGVDYISRIQFETRGGESIAIGVLGSETTARWGTLSDSDACLAGVYGVYTDVGDNVLRVDSIGFYFERPEPEPEVEEEVVEAEDPPGVFLYITIILAVVAVMLVGILIFLCCSPGRNAIAA